MAQINKRIPKGRKTRFVATGILNTAVNFAVLNFSFFVLGLDKFISIIVATSCAILVSFVLNRNFVFIDRVSSRKKFPKFVLVSAAGVFIIQNSVYAICAILLLKATSDLIAINLSNIIASLTVAIWNYNGYKLFVFEDSTAGV